MWKYVQRREYGHIRIEYVKNFSKEKMGYMRFGIFRWNKHK